MKKPLKTYYWNGKPNFGDAINIKLIENLSGREVVFAKVRNADFFAIGSNMKFAIRRAAYEEPLAVWTTGMIEPVEFTFPDHVHVAAVRGPKTAAMLGLEGKVAYGDAGLLCDEIVPGNTPKKYGLGIVPHHRHLGQPFVDKILADNPSAKLVRVDHEDPWETVREIQSCEAIISSSLHGLIVADCYHIPNFFLAHNAIKLIMPFKFTDYEASAQRKVPVVKISDIPDLMGNLSDYDHGYFARIDQLKTLVHASFPANFLNDLP